ncbi:MAG: hypothetical protein HKP08_00230 [Flavobacteriaceae bacterium]|nr:hypothetical protein [Flavobacteriaceae bacterium]
MRVFTILFLCIIGTSCAQHGQLTYVCSLPGELEENSGLATFETDKVWLIEDNNNKDLIYEVNVSGEYLRDFKVKNAKNDDWEDLTQDEAGNLYIGDFGNNENKRKEFVIYKLPNPLEEKGDKIDAEKIEFSYPEQKKFPPEPARRKYDTEAFFYLDSLLYIITKDRSNPFSGEALIYTVPAFKGKYDAKLVGVFSTCKDYSLCQITSAAISPDSKTIALLGYGSLWLVRDFNLPDFSGGKVEFIDLGVRSQLEAICFKDNKTVYISDEENQGFGRNLYSFVLPDSPKKKKKED